MKKLKYIIFLVIGLCMFIPNVFARQVTCQYMDYGHSSTDTYFKITFDVADDGSSSKAIDVQLANVTSGATEGYKPLSYFNVNFGFNIYSEIDCPASISYDPASKVITTPGYIARADGSMSQDNSWLNSSKVSCGGIQNIPTKIPEITSMVVNILEVLVPLLLIIFGAIDLGKGVTGGKEDEIKKGQQSFIKRLITGMILFFVIALAKLLIGIVADNTVESSNIIQCVDCFISNKCSN